MDTAAPSPRPKPPHLAVGAVASTLLAWPPCARHDVGEAATKAGQEPAPAAVPQREPNSARGAALEVVALAWDADNSTTVSSTFRWPYMGYRQWIHGDVSQQ